MSAELKIKLALEGATQTANGVNDVANGVSRIGQAGRDAQSHVADLRQQITLLTGTMAGITSVQQAISAASDYAGLTSRIKLLTGSTDEAAAAMQTVYDIAQRQHTSLAAVGDSYAKIGQALNALGGNATDTAQMVETVAASLRLGNASTAEAASTMRQFGQAMAKGKLNGDEFVSLMENAPNLMDAVASSLGKTKGELFTMAEQGKLTAQVFGDAVLESFSAVTAKAAALPPTIGQAMENVTSAFTRAAGESRTVGLASSIAMTAMGQAAEHASSILDNLATVALVAVARSAMLAGVAIKDKVAATLAENAASLASLQGTVASTRAATAETQAKIAQFQAGLGLLDVSRAQALASLNATQATIAQARAQLAAAESAGALSFALASARDATATLSVAQARQAALVRELAELGASQAAMQKVLTSTQAAHTAATAAQTEAQLALNTAASWGAKAMGLLGGPIGLVTTALSMGLTAWSLWGSTASSAAASASGAMEKSTASILTQLDTQIERLQRRNAAAKMQGNTGGLDLSSDEANKIGELQIKIDALRKHRSADQMENARNLTEINALLSEQGQIQSRLADRDKLGAEDRARKSLAALSGDMKQYTAETNKADAAVKAMRETHGALFTPAMEAQVRSHFKTTTKGHKDLGDAFADTRTAAKAWEDAIKASDKIISKTTAGTQDLSEGQRLLRDYLASSAWAINEKTNPAMNRLAEQSLKAAIASE